MRLHIVGNFGGLVLLALLHLGHEVGLLLGEFLTGDNVLKVDLVEDLHAFALFIHRGHLVGLEILGQGVGLDGENGLVAHMHHQQTLVEVAVEGAHGLQNAVGMTHIAEGLEGVEAHSHLTHQHIAVLHLLGRLVLLFKFVMQTVVGGLETGHVAVVACSEHHADGHNHCGNT